jgi:hypothetical protein
MTTTATTTTTAAARVMTWAENERVHDLRLAMCAWRADTDRAAHGHGRFEQAAARPLFIIEFGLSPLMRRAVCGSRAPDDSAKSSNERARFDHQTSARVYERVHLYLSAPKAPALFLTRTYPPCD